MRQRKEAEQEVFEILKAARSAIRLKHSILAEREINRRLPELEDKAYKAISAGGVFELNTDSLLKDDDVQPIEATVIRFEP